MTRSLLAPLALIPLLCGAGYKTGGPDPAVEKPPPKLELFKLGETGWRIMKPIGFERMDSTAGNTRPPLVSFFKRGKGKTGREYHLEIHVSQSYERLVYLRGVSPCDRFGGERQIGETIEGDHYGHKTWNYRCTQFDGYELDTGSGYNLLVEYRYPWNPDQRDAGLEAYLRMQTSLSPVREIIEKPSNSVVPLLR